jgi:TetR/AcrR family transcriptional regulator, fatty acid metabolism regulator protein
MNMTENNTAKMKSEQPGPAGKFKLAEALRELLEKKDFISITTANIARTAGVNEALIYRYYGDKRGLLHHLLSEYLDSFIKKIAIDVKGIEGAINKLRKLIWTHIYLYDYNRVFAKILLLEVRNYPGYFTSETYRTVKVYARMILELIEEGVENGEIRNDISATLIRQIILGGIEHLCLPAIIFNREMDVDALQKELCNVIFKGIQAVE